VERATSDDDGARELEAFYEWRDDELIGSDRCGWQAGLPWERPRVSPRTGTEPEPYLRYSNLGVPARTPEEGPTPMSDSETLFVRPAEAARRLAIGKTRLYEEMAAGRLRSVRHGRSRLISTTALAEFAQSLEAGSEASAVRHADA